MEHPDKVNILVVDDRIDRVIALEAVLEDLGENIVRASSGTDALRHLLEREFAVILLDINMPGMDGFETASFIRQRPATRDVPIIFITAYQDEVQVMRGYSLGAVDYIQTPVVPEVLRTKVRVFVDLWKKTQQIQRQSAWLRQHATQLHKLTAASVSINSANSLKALLDTVTATARDVIDANLVSATAVIDEDWSHATTAASVAGEYAQAPPDSQDLGASGLRSMVCRMNKPVRMTRRELAEYPLYQAEEKTWRGLPLSGWLAAPLIARDGRSLGLIEVSDKTVGEFSDEDEAVLVQLAQMASTAIENILFVQEREVNRLKDEFLWTLSHELRTPLNTIMGYAQLLTLGPLPEDIGQAVKAIEYSARAQARLIDDMLDLSRIVRGTLRLNVRAIELCAAVQGAVDAIRPVAAEKDLAVTCTLPDSPIQVLADPERLQQIVSNLLSNSVKFTPSGGKIEVQVQQEGSHVLIRVTDTGQGIKPAFLPWVFERFRQADSSSTRRHTGLGIGLSIVRHLVELHHGSVTAESDGEGKGATFSVTLPVHVPALTSGVTLETPEDGQPPLDFDAPGDLSGIRILLVDDEPSNRELLGNLLSRLKARVTLVGSAQEALKSLAQSPPNVLVSDIAMPDQDGYELIRAVRRLPPEQGGEVPAIALTAYAREEDRVRALSAGFQAHLAKPVEPAKLVHTLLRVLPIPVELKNNRSIPARSTPTCR